MSFDFKKGDRVRLNVDGQPFGREYHGELGEVRIVIGRTCAIALDAGWLLIAVPFELLEPEEPPSILGAPVRFSDDVEAPHIVFGKPLI